MKRRSFFQSAAAAVLGTIAAVYAPSVVGADNWSEIPQLNKWLAAVDLNWSNPANWSLDRVPESADHVVFDGSANMTINDEITLPSTVNVESLTMAATFKGKIGNIGCPLRIGGPGAAIDGT